MGSQAIGEPDDYGRRRDRSAGRMTVAPGGRHVRVRAMSPRRSGAGWGGEKK
jgi:hypothetical protein